jgi:hypothetical protein
VREAVSHKFARSGASTYDARLVREAVSHKFARVSTPKEPIYICIRYPSTVPRILRYRYARTDVKVIWYVSDPS